MPEKSARIDMDQARKRILKRIEKLKGRKFADSVELIREDRER
ncbi:MAG: hypothetical protein AB9879_13735 [Methanothrix sp.]